MKSNQLFKKDKPVIRPFRFIEGTDPGDVPYLWDAYRKGIFKEVPEGFTMQNFVDYIDGIKEVVQEVWIVEDRVNDEYKPIGFVICKNDGWLLEPHVQYFDNATPRTILRTYVAFMKKTKYRKDIGSCLVRVEKNTTNLANRIEKMGLLKYVGKIWGGRPSGNEYLYSVRCGRRQ